MSAFVPGRASEFCHLALGVHVLAGRYLSCAWPLWSDGWEATSRSSLLLRLLLLLVLFSIYLDVRVCDLHFLEGAFAMPEYLPLDRRAHLTARVLLVSRRNKGWLLLTRSQPPTNDFILSQESQHTSYRCPTKALACCEEMRARDCAHGPRLC